MHDSVTDLVDDVPATLDHLHKRAVAAVLDQEARAADGQGRVTAARLVDAVALPEQPAQYRLAHLLARAERGATHAAGLRRPATRQLQLGQPGRARPLKQLELAALEGGCLHLAR